MIGDLIMMLVGVGAIYGGVYGLKYIFDKFDGKFKI